MNLEFDPYHAERRNEIDEAPTPFPELMSPHTDFADIRSTHHADANCRG